MAGGRRVRLDPAYPQHVQHHDAGKAEDASGQQALAEADKKPIVPRVFPAAEGHARQAAQQAGTRHHDGQ